MQSKMEEMQKMIDEHLSSKDDSQSEKDRTPRRNRKRLTEGYKTVERLTNYDIRDDRESNSFENVS